MRSRSPSLLIVLLVAFLVPTAAEAQVNRLRRAAENAIIGETARQIQRLLRDAVRCAIDDPAPDSSVQPAIPAQTKMA